jgi:hypothetical protein
VVLVKSKLTNGQSLPVFHLQVTLGVDGDPVALRAAKR